MLKDTKLTCYVVTWLIILIQVLVAMNKANKMLSADPVPSLANKLIFC